MSEPKRYYSTSVSAIRFDGHNYAEMIEFGTDPAGSRPRVWRSPWLDDHNEPIDGLAFINGGPSFYQLKAGDWLIREPDGVLKSCDDATFQRLYTSTEPGT